MDPLTVLSPTYRSDFSAAIAVQAKLKRITAEITMDNKRFFDIDIHLRFFAPNKSLCIINAIRIRFVSIFRRNFFQIFHLCKFRQKESRTFVYSHKCPAFLTDTFRNFHNLIVWNVSHNGMCNPLIFPT